MTHSAFNMMCDMKSNENDERAVMKVLSHSLPSSWITVAPPEWLSSYIYNLVSDRFADKIKEFIRLFKSPIEEKWENYVD